MKGQSNKVIWLAWQKHRRTESICDYLGIPMYAETVSANRIVRYMVLAARSLRIIHSVRPDVLIVQNPSLVLCLQAIALRLLYQYKLVVDAHNEGVLPYANQSDLFRYLTDYIIRKADYTIVTNRYLADIVKRKRGNPLVLPDRLPLKKHVDSNTIKDKHSRKIFLLICTHAKDEPVEKIFAAVGQYRDEILLLVTGRNDPGTLRRYHDIPDNVRFTGFLSDDEYFATLATSDCVIDLTLMEYCLVCGAYEAVSFGKPMILSDDPACREIFSKGAVYTLAETTAITVALKEALSQLVVLTHDVQDLKIELDAAWKEYADGVVERLGIDVQ